MDTFNKTDLICAQADTETHRPSAPPIINGQTSDTTWEGLPEHACLYSQLPVAVFIDESVASYSVNE